MHTGVTWWKSATDGQRDHRTYFRSSIEGDLERGNGVGQEFNKRKNSNTCMLEIFRFQGHFGLKYNLWESV